MNEAAEKEPTMEEILASIRRIISEDGADEDTSGSQEPDMVEHPLSSPASDSSDPLTTTLDEQEPERESTPQFQADDDVTDDSFDEEDVLELTELAEEADILETDPYSDDEGLISSEPAADDDILVSKVTERQAGASFAELSAMLVGGYEGAGNTLEGLVRDMLKPMLQAWLDENLPRIVEDMVEREIARIAARKGHK